MAALRVTRKSLQRRYGASANELLRLAVRMPGRPTPDDIHDLRVTARRIQVMRRLLPAEVRQSQASKRFDLVLKSVMKSTSQLRDMDTLMDTLGGHGSSLPPELFVTLENQRSDASARARAPIAVLADIPAPDLEQSEIRGKKVSRRLRKSVRRRGRRISGLLTRVLNDESKVEELHSLRKEAKKMRYLLELADGESGQLATLTKWQESLGGIHDLDVAVAYLDRYQFAHKQDAILGLTRARHASYAKFVHDFRTSYMRGEEVPFKVAPDFMAIAW